MPFSLSNAASTFWAMTNPVLSNLLDEDVITYIDDMLLYTESESKYIILQ